MSEKIKINDWVKHERFRLIGQVKKIIRSKEGTNVLKVWTDDKLPLQTWEEDQVAFDHRDGNIDLPPSD